jgi:hypothetical protein
MDRREIELHAMVYGPQDCWIGPAWYDWLDAPPSPVPAFSEEVFAEIERYFAKEKRWHNMTVHRVGDWTPVWGYDYQMFGWWLRVDAVYVESVRAEAN